MKRLILVTSVSLILLLAGCAQSISPKCRHNAVLQALVFGEEYPTRIAYGPSSSGSGKNHAQAQAYIDGRWRWLKNVQTIVEVGRKDNFEPKNYVGVEGALKWSVKKTAKK
jgi:hypothetical protein